MGCDLTMEGVRQLSLALRSFNTSLKHFNFSHNRIGNGQLVDVILALSMHSQLEKIQIIRMNIVYSIINSFTEYYQAATNTLAWQ